MISFFKKKKIIWRVKVWKYYYYIVLKYIYVWTKHM